jgi:type II secretory pathway component GspD/PulD (secretin)
MRGMIVAGISLCFFGASAFAQEKGCVTPKEKVGLEFRDASVSSVAEFFSATACKKFIISPKIQNERITLLSSSLLPTDEAYKAFESALGTVGVSVTTEGKFIKLDAKNNQNGPVTGLASPFAASWLELSFIEGKSTSIYKIPAPTENRAARLEQDTQDTSLSFEFAWSKEKNVLQYEIKRQVAGKTDRSSMSLYGTIQVPSSGKVSLLESTGLSLQLSVVP